MDLARATLVLIRVLRTLINSIAKNLHKLQICLRFYSFYKKLDIQANSQLPDLNRPFSRRPPVCSFQASPLTDGGFLPPFPPYPGGVRCATRFKFFLQKKIHCRFGVDCKYTKPTPGLEPAFLSQTSCLLLPGVSAH